MASFLKIWHSFCKVPGKLSQGRKPTHLHSWIIPQAQKHWICNGFIPQIGCSFCEVPGKLSQGNKPTTYILGSFCKLKNTKLQWLHSSKLMFILQSTPCPRTIIVGSSFQECGIEIPCITLEIVDHIVPPQASFCWEFMPFAKQLHQLWTSRPSSAIALRFSSIYFFSVGYI